MTKSSISKQNISADILESPNLVNHFSQNCKNLWDPISIIDNKKIEDDINKIQDTYVSLKDRSRFESRLFIKNIVLSILIFIISLVAYLSIIYLELLSPTYADYLVLLMLIAPFLPFILVVEKYKEISQILVETMFAYKYNNLISPFKDKDRLNTLVRFYPNTFKNNSIADEIEHLIWGVERIDNHNYNYFLGTFTYQRTNKIPIFTYSQIRIPTQTFSIFKLENAVPFRFAIIPKVEEEITDDVEVTPKDEIKKYSVIEEFESLFEIKHFQENPNFDFLNIQIKREIINLYKRKGFEVIEFRDDSVAILLDSLLYKVSHTNILKNLEIKEEDIVNIKKNIQELTKDISKIIQYLN